jgi:hypothetical protein
MTGSDPVGNGLIPLTPAIYFTTYKKEIDFFKNF